ISDPATALATPLAPVSPLRNRAPPEELAMFSKIGLAGEIRPAPRGQERLREAGKLGFPKLLIPQANAPKRPLEGLQPVAVESIAQALNAAWE
ncbi:MAG: DNA repair protein RadA, partial [Betaproteobacteria bacterium]